VSTSSLEDTRVVGATTGIALDRIAGEAPDAVRLLHLCAFLAPDDIPRRMLLAGAPAVPERLRGPIRDSRVLVESVGVLNRYGLLDVQVDALGMHRTRQAAVRDELDRPAQEAWASAAARIAREAFPAVTEPVATWEWAGRVLPHASRAIDHLERLGIEPLLALELRLRTARYMTYQGQLGSADASLRCALEHVEGLEGAGRMHASILNQLAVVEREAGSFNPARRRALDALSLHSRALAVAAHGQRAPDESSEVRRSADDAQLATIAQLPPDPEIADVLRNLGAIAQRQGYFGEATRHVAEAHRILTQLNGPDAIELAPILELAFAVYLDASSWDEARKALRRALAIREAHDDGDGHEAMIDRFLVDMLTEPASTRARAPDFVAHLESTFGPLHSETADGRRMLGVVLRRNGELDDARSQFAHALDIHSRNLGPHHYRVAAAMMEFLPLDLALQDAAAAEQRLREVIAIVMAAPEDERVTILRLSLLEGTLSELLLDSTSQPFVHRAVEIIVDAASGDAVVTGAALQTIVRALRKGGDQLLAEGRLDEARAEYEHGLDLAQRTEETRLDDADFLVRLGYLAAVAGARTEPLALFREAIACMREAELSSPLWTLARQCAYLAAMGNGSGVVRTTLDRLFDEAREEGAVTEFRAAITAMVPEGWFVKESTTLVSPDGQANIIASSEPLDPTIDSAAYAETQGSLLEKEFSAYEEKTFEQVAVFGDHDGYVRTFEWTPRDGVRVAQVQVYFAEAGRGYTATATTPLSNMPAVEIMLAQTLRGLRLARDAAR
jgi:tetratricopeptide (TPR) repeat protein